MSFHKLSSLLMAVFFILTIASCKKNEETTTILYLDGQLKVNMQEFVRPESVVTFTPKGVVHPEKKGVGYSWRVTPVMEKYDTTRFENGLNAQGQPSDGSFTFKFPDSLGTYTVYCYGFAEGYSSSSMTIPVTVVDPDKSIFGRGTNELTDSYITVGDNKFYYTRIGDLDWFMQNLAYTEKGTPFRKSKPMDGVFGLFYSYEEAVNACPQGWRLPTAEDWASLGAIITDKEDNASDYTYSTIPDVASKLMSDASFNKVRMWEYWPSVGKITNSSKMCMIPEGYANLEEKDSEGKYPAAIFKGVYEYAVFWTADKADDGMAYYRYLYCDEPDFMIEKGDVTNFGASVRCVRDAN